MRFVEIKKLNEFIEASREFIEASDVKEIFTEVDSQNIMSLQGEALRADAAYLREVSSLLNVIITIISHPHISGKTEDVIVRIEQANALGSEEFRQVLRESKLWKRHGHLMIPEEVHYRQHIDELRIYENRFIVLLINLIDKELLSYSTFYLSMLPTIKGGTKYLSAGEIGEIIVEVDLLRRKIQYLKGTYFYKVVSEGKPLTGTIRPTNILTKDRLYKYCYKFYRTFAHHGDLAELCENLRIYYVMYLLRALRERGFFLDGGSDKSSEVLMLRNGEFKISLEITDFVSIIAKISYGNLPVATHLLLFGAESGKPQDNTYDISQFTSTEIISLWDLVPLDFDGEKIFAPEMSLIGAWLDSKLTTANIERRLYEKYCPVCRSRSITNENAVFRCAVCTSEYSFIESSKEEKVWFRKIRK
jgi:hypothetical protein